MSYLLALTIFCSMAAMVFCRSFQQKNVMHNHYALVMPTSFAMAGLDFVSYTLVLGETITNGFSATAALFWLAAGFGGGTGCISAMYMHNRFVSKRS